jgi:CMP-N,N'-diacetyllegionaminic acid synthase
LVVGLVAARAGSKGVPGKNVADLDGLPLLAYSVAAGCLAAEVDRVIVTTDDAGMAELAVAHGAEAPFLRPAELSGDMSLDIDYVRHALGWLAEHEGAAPELVVQLRPTTPLRNPDVIDQAVRALRERTEATGLRSIHPLSEPPQKMLGIDEDGMLTGLFPHDTRPDYWNLPRQAFPPAHAANGYVDVIRPETVAAGDALYGDRVLAFVTEPVTEVDGPEDLDYLRFTVAAGEHPLVARLRRSARDG